MFLRATREDARHRKCRTGTLVSRILRDARDGARHPRKCLIYAFRNGCGGAWHRL